MVPPDSWNTGEMQIPGMPLGTNSVVSKDLVVCGWGWPESLLNREMCSGLARESSWGGPHCLALGAIVGWGPCSSQALSSSSLGTKKDLGKSGASWFICFLISWSLDFRGGFSVKGTATNRIFLCEVGFSSLGWVGGWNLKAFLTFGAVIWPRGFRWAGGKSL